MSSHKQFVLGVDIGGVIIDRAADNTDTSFFSKNYLQTPPVPGVFEALAELSSAGFRIHLVSKCGESVKGKSLKWLARHNFYQITGVRPDAVHFCLTRQEKAAIAETICATHFIDDRLEVLSYLHAVPHLYLINAVEKEVQQYKSALGKVARVHTWDELVTLLRATLCEAS